MTVSIENEVSSPLPNAVQDNPAELLAQIVAAVREAEQAETPVWLEIGQATEDYLLLRMSTLPADAKPKERREARSEAVKAIATATDYKPSAVNRWARCSALVRLCPECSVFPYRHLRETLSKLVDSNLQEGTYSLEADKKAELQAFAADWAAGEAGETIAEFTDRAMGKEPADTSADDTTEPVAPDTAADAAAAAYALLFCDRFNGEAFERLGKLMEQSELDATLSGYVDAIDAAGRRAAENGQTVTATHAVMQPVLALKETIKELFSSLASAPWYRGKGAKPTASELTAVDPSAITPSVLASRQAELESALVG